VGDTGAHDSAGTVREGLSRPFAAPRAPLAVALALSLLGHALLLVAVNLPRAHERATPAFTAQFSGSFVLDRVPPAAPPVAAAAPPAPHRVVAPAKKAAPAPVPTPAPAPSVPQPPPFIDATELGAPPMAQDDPLGGSALPELQWRRLHVAIWVRADGSVDKVNLESPEVDAGTAQQLKEAVERMRFVPGTRNGQPVAALLTTRLCFDEAGQLLRGAPRCLGPGTAPASPAAPER